MTVKLLLCPVGGEMIQNIKDELAKISKELDEVHPLLQMLFSKIPGLICLEYKQGPNENGADFVLESEHGLLGDSEYIGVVVKKDKITKNSHDVNSQIEQCIKIKRLVKGKKEVFLDEVWVITPKTISHSAQEFFCAKYASTKIKFIDGNHLATLIEKHIPGYFKGVSVGLNNYLIRTRERLETLEKNAHISLKGFESLSFNPQLIAVERIKYKENSHAQNKRRISATLESLLDKKSAILIEGAMGSGKSTLMRTAALKMLEPDNIKNNNRIPVFTTFKELHDIHGCSITALIRSHVDDFDEKDNTCQYVVMVDGVDESQHNLGERVKLLDGIIGESAVHDNISLVMTARRLDESAIKSKLKHSFKSYQVAPLSLKQIVKVLEETCRTVNLKNRVIEDLKKSDLYRSLPQTPIAAILLARLLNENQHHLPSNLTELYAKYSELALGRWDIGKDLNTNKVYSACYAVTKRIANHFIDYDLTSISKEEALEFFKDYLSARQLDLNAQEVFNNLVDRSDLFYIDELRGSFGFKHRTFIEFFYAASLSDNYNRVLGEEVFELYWATIYFFWIGLKKDCPDVLTELSNIKTSHERTRLLKIINLGNMLLAGYESPYQSIECAIQEIFLEASRFLIDLYEGRVETRLSSLSKMTLLCVFRYVMTDSYGYEFFSEAIDTSMINIAEDESIEPELKATALFLLDTAQSAPVIENLFDKVASPDFIKNAPVTVQLAISHEAKARNIQNEHIKRIQRNLRRVFKDRANRQQLKYLYDMPIKKLNS